MASDPFHLDRFVQAQAGCYEQVRRELTAGEKRTHWMWFIFPQISGLGSSSTARLYAISGLPEAHAYLSHAVLGPRLKECAALVNSVQGRTLSQIFGYPDDLKFHSSMTLFAAADAQAEVFRAALRRYCNDVPDQATLDRIRAAAP